MKCSKNLLLLLFVFSFSNLFSQQDTLIFKDGSELIGKIQSMQAGGLAIETALSDDDLIIKWYEVSEIYTVNKYLITLDTGEILHTLISTASFDKSKMVVLREGKPAFINGEHIITINPGEDEFFERISVSVDGGLTVTKANNLRQFTMRSNVGYIAPSWDTYASFDAVLSAQDSIADTKRNEINAGFNYTIYGRFYGLVQINFLQSEELKLQLRSNPKLGLGYHLIRSNAMFLNLVGGASYNNEVYTAAAEPDRESSEAFMGLGLNIFNLGSLGILSNLTAFKGITDSDRRRVDFKIDFKYDFPYNLYLKFGYTHNFDNKPALDASENDYVFQTTVGWEL